MSMNSQQPVETEMKEPEKEIIQIPYTCGSNGLPFRGIYKRNANGIYGQQKLERLAPTGDPSESCDDVALIDMDKVEINDFTCPWCQKSSNKTFYIRCGNCGVINCSSSFEYLGNDLYDFDCIACGREGRSVKIGRMENVAVGEGGTSGSLDGSVKKLSYGQV